MRCVHHRLAYRGQMFRDWLNPEAKPQPHNPQLGTAFGRGQSCSCAVSGAEMGGSWEAAGQGKRPTQPGGPQPSLQGNPPAQIPNASCWPILHPTSAGYRQCCVRSTLHPGFGGSLLNAPASNTCQVTLPLTSERHWEKAQGGKEARPPRTVPAPKAHGKTQPDMAVS